ncbi:TetR/AcrR family transcriptional regulator [Gallaecimonas mangrovi]|uniref:TetR/AcrR family transcriptional regulator n=1 Tax=Gallaecimonas mangrovi TaxID=2291597 RepID=UPI0018673A6E|nr:TetR/AcrR family transcriptional regulator [Gallaecimonas mangrovi]
MIKCSKLADKRQMILEATEKLLAHYGFHGLSMQLVAKEAGVAAGTIYRYFDSKNSLILALHDQVICDVGAQLLAEYDPSSNLRSRFDYLWNQSWALFIEKPDLLVCKSQFERLPLELASSMSSAEEEVFAPVKKFWEEGRASGAFKTMADEVFGALTFEVCANLAFKHLAGKVNLDANALDNVRNACWDAIAADGG